MEKSVTRRARWRHGRWWIVDRVVGLRRLMLAAWMKNNAKIPWTVEGSGEGCDHFTHITML
jgi:hypothetical protein